MERPTPYLLIGLLFLCSVLGFGQTKVSGIVKDEFGDPVAFANVLFKNSTQGTITNDNGRFYMESEKRYDTLLVSFIGFETTEVPLASKVNYDMEVVLMEGSEKLDEVVIYVGKQSKKNNPAIDILKKIWANKQKNGLYKYKYYEHDKYEKIEFDLNTIDSAMMKSRVFKGMEFVFDNMDTSRITGKTYLPIFINETFSKVYGDNGRKLEKEEVLGTRNSGFEGNQSIYRFIEDLYSDYNVYDNYLKLFDKSFTSPISKTGVDVYNYVLADSAYIEDKWCYNIIYYPRRKNELTFKGDFWVNDTTFALKRINMQVTRSANINWVKDMYLEQEFELVNDSVFLLKRDYMLNDFAFKKKEKAKGVYGKRTTVYDNYLFDKPKPDKFYKTEPDPFSPELAQRDDAFWEKNRLESLNENEKGVYQMLDTLRTVPKFKSYYNLVSILASGYVEIDKWNLDLGSVYSVIGNNEAEGWRLRLGARTYFGQNDPWRLQGFMAYGFKDKKVKFGIAGKVMVDKKNRIILSGGTRRAIDQLGGSLTASNDVLGRSVASSGILTVGANNRLTNIKMSALNVQMEPFKNVRVQVGAAHRDMKSALPDAFSLDYIDPESPTGISSTTKQFDIQTHLLYTPGRRVVGYGVEPKTVDNNYSLFFLNYTKGIKGTWGSDFDYEKLQLAYAQPFTIGGFGRLKTSVEVGKTFGEVPLSLLSVVPGNQTFFTIFNTFPNLDFYEFVTDTYASVHLEHNFNGRLFSRIPWMRKLNWREIVGVRAVWGSLSDANIALSSPTNIPLEAPSDKPYYEYSVGVSNIFKVLRVDFNFRGNYLDNPNARPFAIRGAIGFKF